MKIQQKFGTLFAALLRPFGLSVLEMAVPVLKWNKYSSEGVDGFVHYFLSKFPDVPHTLADVGANFWEGGGSNSRLLVEAGWRALLIEPYPPAVDNLVKNLGSNPLVTIVPHAVSVDQGPSQIKVNWHGVFEGLLVDAKPVMQVLRNFSSNLPSRKISIIKIDVDGMDNEIAEGIDFLEFDTKLVIIEIDSSNVDNLKFQSEIMLKKGYVPILHSGNVFYCQQRDLAQWLFSQRKGNSSLTVAVKSPKY